MSALPETLLRIAHTDAARRLSSLSEPFAVLFERGDLSVELFAPREADTQSPHRRDELYIVIAQRVPRNVFA
jgi:hypothetical protein